MSQAAIGIVLSLLLLLFMPACKALYFMHGQTQPIEKELTNIVATKTVPADLSVTYDDMHGLWGGVTISVGGDGNVEAREREHGGQNPKITNIKISREQLLELIKLLTELKAWEQQTPERQPVPDESRARLSIKCGGQISLIWEWFNDMEKNRRLMRIKTKMREFVKE